MAIVSYESLNLNKNELQNAVVQNLASAPSSPVEGQVYFDTTLDHTRQYINGAWVNLSTENDVPANVVTRSVAGSNAGELLVSGGADRTATKFSGSAGLVKVDGNGVAATATAGTDYVTSASTNTFTNKTFDANGTGNSISNIEVADFAGGVVITDTTLSGASNSTLPSAAAIKTYVDNLVDGRNWGTAVRVASTANVTLASGAENGDTIDGVALVTGDRILLKDQTSATENGVYTVNAVGSPTRAGVAADLANHAFFVEEGSTLHDTAWVCENDAITFGVTNITFVQIGSGSVPDASTTVKGKVELATTAEAKARTDATLAVTPAGLASFPIAYSTTFNNTTDWVGGAAPYTFTVTAATHGLGAGENKSICVKESGTEVMVGKYANPGSGDVVLTSNSKFTGSVTIIAK